MHSDGGLRVDEERVDQWSGATVLGHRPRLALALGEHLVGRLQQHSL